MGVTLVVAAAMALVAVAAIAAVGWLAVSWCGCDDETDDYVKEAGDGDR